MVAVSRSVAYHPTAIRLAGNAFGEITGVNLLTMDSQQAMHFNLPDPRVHLDVGFISASGSVTA